MPSLRPVYGGGIVDGFEQGVRSRKGRATSARLGATLGVRRRVLPAQLEERDEGAALRGGRGLRHGAAADAAAGGRGRVDRRAEGGARSAATTICSACCRRRAGRSTPSRWPDQAAADEGSLRVHALRTRAQLIFRARRPRDLPKAEKALKKVDLIDPKFAEAHRILGRVYLDAGRAGAGVVAVRLRARSQARLLRGACSAWRGSSAEGNRARATELVEKALEARPVRRRDARDAGRAPVGSGRSRSRAGGAR